MADIRATVVELGAIDPHPNADRLAITQVGGWQMIIPAGKYVPGDRMVYIPPDALVPLEWADKWGVTQYLRGKEGAKRVGRVSLRGLPSFGLLAPLEGDWGVGYDATADLGITKYEPPPRTGVWDAEPSHPLFPEYTTLENLRAPENQGILVEGEPVWVAEKIHGANVRWARIVENGQVNWYAGSRRLQRRAPTPSEGQGVSMWWFAFDRPGSPLRAMMDWLAKQYDTSLVVVYGEIFGPGVQYLHYGRTSLDYVVFDINVGGRFLSGFELDGTALVWNVPLAPLLGAHPYSLALVKSLSEGPSLVPGADHYREGVVVRPMEERRMADGRRVIFKFVSDTYLMKDGGDVGEV